MLALMRKLIGLNQPAIPESEIYLKDRISGSVVRLTFVRMSSVNVRVLVKAPDNIKILRGELLLDPEFPGCGPQESRATEAKSKASV